MFIYKIENLVNKKVYVGQTGTSFKQRKRQHLCRLRKQKHGNQHLQNAWNKYGEENFVFEIIEEVEEEKLLTEREQFWCDFYESNNKEKGYNIRICVDSNKGIVGWSRGKKRPELAGKNNPMYGKNPIPWNKGKKCENLSKANSGENSSSAKLTWKQVDEIRKKYSTGKYDGKIGLLAKEYRIVRSGISEIISNKKWIDKNYNPPEKYINVKLNWDMIDEIRAIYEQNNFTYKELALEYGVAEITISRIIKNEAWKDKNYQKPCRFISVKAKLNWDKAEKIREIYGNENITYKELSKIYNVGKTTIYNILNYKIYRGKK